MEKKKFESKRYRFESTKLKTTVLAPCSHGSDPVSRRRATTPERERKSALSSTLSLLKFSSLPTLQRKKKEERKMSVIDILFRVDVI